MSPSSASSATASAYYGRQVAFLGADIGDSVIDGQAFMQQHPVSYPSYHTSSAQLTSIIPQGLLGTPTTVFINRAGKIVYRAHRSVRDAGHAGLGCRHASAAQVTRSS